ncbi:MAG: AAA ATPase [Candidatus Peregrinibacteria bacterium GW2011_GWF2_33_10]|nr:MAG: AAA ATPase [Candidatus Peregrinibacteria bacterium GW2011_GWF2_33_10]OGJ44205.1 MAG: hypothetical protein A2263_04490 [Candidatus Peregrinibacteria bacterium RIFOXYA2_FULL_33_21]OGJ46689.1 MAG: hypothetical protein A2272_04750 [Candidatus Peregrinibacteria bacterium RIFOXYA12_FULL_33_12]OGJ51834.1 MAG: hypothetical protein A2307_05155 [Candidatus Peregrinibacteria bacterium RIFOXYB2_FULL_33_20]
MFNRKIIRYLTLWKEKKDRKPLIIRGARQIGKTSAVEMFAKENFDNYVYINMEDPDDAMNFEGKISLSDFEKQVQIFKHKQLKTGTLIFIDEVQQNPHLISLLRFFYEKRPDLYVISAGSLLEIRLKQAKISMPVGRTEYVFMYPLDFFEYLEAKGEKELLDYLQNIKLGAKIIDSIHNKTMGVFKEYILIGGMPEAVKNFIENSDFDSVQSIYSSLMKNFIDDINKYANKSEIEYLTKILRQSPFYSGSKIKYENFGDLGIKSREVSNAMDILQHAMLIKLVNSTNSISVPLQVKSKRAKKLLFLDTGFYNYVYKIPFNIDLQNFESFYRGNVFEQVVGQNIIAQDLHGDLDLFYWTIDQDKGSAEVDFCFSKGLNIYAIEVKSGKNKISKSLISFGRKIPNCKLIKFHTGNTHFDSKNKILNLPIYLSPRVNEL